MSTSEKFKVAHRLMEESASEFKRAHNKGMKSINRADVMERSRELRNAIAREREAIKKQRLGIKLQREAISDLNTRPGQR